MSVEKFGVAFVALCAFLPGLQGQATRPLCYSCVDPYFQSLIDNGGQNPVLITEPTEGETTAPTCLGGKSKWTEIRLHSTTDERCVEVISDVADILGARGLMSVENIKTVFGVPNVPESGSLGIVDIDVDWAIDPNVKVRVCNTELCNGSLGLRSSGFLAVALPALLAVLRLLG